MTGYRTHRLRLVKAVLIALITLVSAPVHADSWPTFGPWIDTLGNSSGWRAEPDGSLVTVVAAEGGRDHASRSIVMIRAAGPSEISVYTLLTWDDDPDLRVQRADIAPVRDGYLVALSLLTHGSDGDTPPGRTIRLYRYDDHEASRQPTARPAAGFDTPDAMIDLGAPGPEMSWQLSADESGTELYWSRPDGHGGYELLRRRVSDRLVVGDPEKVHTAAHPIVELQVIRSDPMRSNSVLVWVESDGRQRTLASAEIAGGDITIGPRVSIGQAALYSPGLRMPDSLIGPGIRPGLRPSVSGALTDGRLVVAAAHIERSQSALSVFWTGLALHELRFDGTPPQRRWIVEPAPAALFSFPTIALESGAPTVLFLHDRVGAGGGSDVYLWREGDGGDARARNLSATPRRVVAPGLARHDDGVIMTWFSEQRIGFAPSVRTDTSSALRSRLPITMEGDAAETVVSALLALPVASVVSVYYALVATAPALISVMVMIAAFHRFRPDAMRRHGAFVVALMYAYCVAVYGRVPWSFAPAPATVLPVIGLAAVALLGLLGWYRQAERRSLPTPAECTGAIAIALVAPAASTAFSLVMATFGETGPMPLILGG